MHVSCSPIPSPTPFLHPQRPALRPPHLAPRPLPPLLPQKPYQPIPKAPTPPHPPIQTSQPMSYTNREVAFRISTMLAVMSKTRRTRSQRFHRTLDPMNSIASSLLPCPPPTTPSLTQGQDKGATVSIPHRKARNVL